MGRIALSLNQFFNILSMESRKARVRAIYSMFLNNFIVSLLNDFPKGRNITLPTEQNLT